MNTLEEARDWYLATVGQIRILQRLGNKYWDGLDWGGPLGRDQHLRSVERVWIAEQADRSLRPLDDLAVLVLFSVFESTVRGTVRDQVAAAAADLKHPTLMHAAEEALESIEEGSFFRVLEPFKVLDAGLVEEANQVRRYRNWVAHGRRGDPPGSPPIDIDPQTAYNRLSRCLRLILGPPEATA